MVTGSSDTAEADHDLYDKTAEDETGETPESLVSDATTAVQESVGAIIATGEELDEDDDDFASGATYDIPATD